LIQLRKVVDGVAGGRCTVIVVDILGDILGGFAVVGNDVEICRGQESVYPVSWIGRFKT